MQAPKLSPPPFLPHLLSPHDVPGVVLSKTFPSSLDLDNFSYMSPPPLPPSPILPLWFGNAPKLIHLHATSCPPPAPFIFIYYIYSILSAFVPSAEAVTETTKGAEPNSRTSTTRR